MKSLIYPGLPLSLNVPFPKFDESPNDSHSTSYSLGGYEATIKSLTISSYDPALLLT
jgi:hypothetical protein